MSINTLYHCEKCNTDFLYTGLLSVVEHRKPGGVCETNQLFNELERGIMLSIKDFERKQFDVGAVQVTEDNFDEVAEWCGGKVIPADSTPAKAAKHIKVKVHRPINKKQTEAYLTDWVLQAKEDGSFKVYTDAAFRNSFNEKNAKTTKFVQVTE